MDLYNGFNGLRHRINWTYFTVLDGLAHPLYSSFLLLMFSYKPHLYSYILHHYKCLNIPKNRYIIIIWSYNNKRLKQYTLSKPKFTYKLYFNNCLLSSSIPFSISTYMIISNPVIFNHTTFVIYIIMANPLILYCSAIIVCIIPITIRFNPFILS